MIGVSDCPFETRDKKREKLQGAIRSGVNDEDLDVE